MSKKTLSEANGTFFMNKNGLYEPKNDFLEEAAKIKQEKEEKEAKEKLLELNRQKQEDLNKRLETLEMVPNGNKLIILPYPINPYRRIMTSGGIITEYDGDFKNPDSGEWDKQKELVGCAQIIEVGPKCEFAKVGDDIFYDTRTTYPVPFMSMGYLLTTEPQILTFMNDGLKARLKME